MKKHSNRPGTIGWQSMLAVKHEILYQYRLARKYSNSHIVQVHHGNVAEAVFRRMLGKFLPKRYGVTAGYIVSQSFEENGDTKVPHFDVIVYDQLEAPVLWVEENPDSSDGGTNMALPAEYVVAVLEVKSSLEPKTVAKAIKKLEELNSLMAKVDKPSERYKKYLPPNFCCGIVFFEVREANRNKVKILSNMFEAVHLRNFMGSIILEAEGESIDSSGRIKFVSFDKPIKNTVDNNRADLFRWQIYGNPKTHPNERYNSVMVQWTNFEFSQFLFDLIAVWNGTYEIGRLSTFYGVNADGIAE